MVTVHVVDSVDSAPAAQGSIEVAILSHSTSDTARSRRDIPADVVKDLLRQHPDVDGIAVPRHAGWAPGIDARTPSGTW